MKVLEKGIMNGFCIQIEDWSEDYSRPYGSTIAYYPKSMVSHNGYFAPKKNEIYRFQFEFNSNEETIKAFEDLISGKKTLSDFKENFSSKREYLDCVV